MHYTCHHAIGSKKLERFALQRKELCSRFARSYCESGESKDSVTGMAVDFTFREGGVLLGNAVKCSKVTDMQQILPALWLVAGRHLLMINAADEHRKM